MAYDAREAARLISWSNKQAGLGPLTEAELIQWIDGGVGLLDWAFTYKDDREKIWYIDFPTLISLRLICLLRSAGVSIESINKATRQLQEELGVDRPLDSGMIWSLHDHNVLDYAGKPRGSEFKTQKTEWKHVYWRLWGEQQCLGIEASLNFGEDGVACAWFPTDDIKIAPRFVSGSPCLTGTRIPTGIIIGMVKAGDNIAELAEDYDVAEERISNAVKWEIQLADAFV